MTKKIIDLLNRIANNQPVPKKIRYPLYQSGYDVFVYDEEEQEYTNGSEYLRVPNHHLNDHVEILDWGDNS